MNQTLKEMTISIFIVGVLGFFIGIYVTSIWHFAVIMPMVLFVTFASVGGLFGWVIGLPFHKGRAFRTIAAYAVGFLQATVGTYRITFNMSLRDYRDSVLLNNPSITESQWISLRDSATQYLTPYAVHNVYRVLAIVLCWIAAYWLVKLLIRKALSRPCPTSG